MRGSDLGDVGDVGEVEKALCWMPLRIGVTPEAVYRVPAASRAAEATAHEVHDEVYDEAAGGGSSAAEGTGEATAHGMAGVGPAAACASPPVRTSICSSPPGRGGSAGDSNGEAASRSTAWRNACGEVCTREIARSGVKCRWARGLGLAGDSAAGLARDLAGLAAGGAILEVLGVLEAASPLRAEGAAPRSPRSPRSSSETA